MSDYILNISVDKLKPHPINESIYGFNPTQHEELKKSIELNGLLEPITINKKYFVMSGHRRLDVIKELGWIDVDCRLSHFENPMISLIELNRYRKKTTKELLRESEILKEEYSKMGGQGKRNDLNGKGKNWTIINVSNQLGVSTTKLKQLKSIQHYEPSLLTEIDMGKISVGKAYQQIRKKYILNGNGGRPLNKFENDFNNLMQKHNPSSKELNHLVKNYNRTLGQK
jgi:hypothetical protein